LKLVCTHSSSKRFRQTPVAAPDSTGSPFFKQANPSTATIVRKLKESGSELAEPLTTSH
jgi:hypothetical protein